MNTVCLGLSLKEFSSSLVEQYNVKSELIDAGLIYLTPLQGLSIGFSQQNTGSKVKYADVEEQLPQQLRVGLAYKTTLIKAKPTDDESKSYPTTINIVADQVSDIEGNSFNSAGFELGYGIGTFRAGYKTGTNFKGYGIGFGFYILTGVTLDYALSLPADLAPANNISLKINW